FSLLAGQDRCVLVPDSRLDEVNGDVVVEATGPLRLLADDLLRQERERRGPRRPRADRRRGRATGHPAPGAGPVPGRRRVAGAGGAAGDLLRRKPPATPPKDLRMDQQLAALLTVWWGSGDLDAARVPADARGRAPAARDRAGIGTVLLAAFEYLHTQQHLHGAGFVSAGPTCLSSPASVCRACSHACGIGDTRLRARASRLPRRGGPKAGFRRGGTAAPGRAASTAARWTGRAGRGVSCRPGPVDRRGRRSPRT